MEEERGKGPCISLQRMKLRESGCEAEPLVVCVPSSVDLVCVLGRSILGSVGSEKCDVRSGSCRRRRGGAQRDKKTKREEGRAEKESPSVASTKMCTPRVVLHIVHVVF